MNKLSAREAAGQVILEKLLRMGQTHYSKFVAERSSQRPKRCGQGLDACATAFAAFLIAWTSLLATAKAADPGTFSPEFSATVKPVLNEYCFKCHSTAKHKGSLDLERFDSVNAVRRDVKPWELMAELVAAGEMPPEGKKQPDDVERAKLLAWVNGFLNNEAIAHAGDPGYVPLRRLSNAEFNYTIRDLTGIDLQPAREFPADGAAGEGFTNAAEALSDMSPTLLSKYLGAAKEVAAHAVLLPDGFRFSQGKTRRDWTNEIHGSIRDFYALYTPDGRLPLSRYLMATVQYRDPLASGATTLDVVAAKEQLNAKYLSLLWKTLSQASPSFPLDSIGARWRSAKPAEVEPLAREIESWQERLWSIRKVGSYASPVREAAENFSAAPSQTLHLGYKPVAGESEVVAYLVAGKLTGPANAGGVVWRRLRLEGAGKTALLLKNYAQFGPAFEVDYPAFFAHSATYLAIAEEAARKPDVSIETLAAERHVDVELAKRWVTLLYLQPATASAGIHSAPEWIPVGASLKRLEEQSAIKSELQMVQGWHRKGNDLPTVVSNNSDQPVAVPGRIPPHCVAMHPMPMQFVAAVWKSPIAGTVHLSGQIVHAHAACGNGIAWWIEHRHENRAEVLRSGKIDLGGMAQVEPGDVQVAVGDSIMVAIDARDGNHFCDLTDVSLKLTESQAPGRSWDLAGDVADNISLANPHPDKFGNAEVWSFVEGPSRPTAKSVASGAVIPVDSILGRWRQAALDPARQIESAKLAEQVTALLTGPRPAQEKSPDRALYDNLVSTRGPLLAGVDLTRLKASNLAPTPALRSAEEPDHAPKNPARPSLRSNSEPASPDARAADRPLSAAAPELAHFGLAAARFGQSPSGQPIDPADLAAGENSIIEIRLPAPLFYDRELVVDAELQAGGADRVERVQLLATPPAAAPAWDGKTPLLAANDSASFARLLAGFDEFRGVFPRWLCYPHIIPTDEVVCLKQYHRDDEPLMRLFLNEQERAALDRLWEEHRFVTQWPIAENKYLPLFIGFTTQDQPKEVTSHFEAMREPFKQRAEQFERELLAAQGVQLQKLLKFAERAFRRPLTQEERQQFTALFQTLIGKGIPHEEAFRDVLARVLVSPSFLFRIEHAPPGQKAGPVNDWELATRLSYFLWSTVPDEELRKAAAENRLHDPQTLAAQTLRMLKDDRTRALAIEFGTQWIHVRDFDQFNEKNEKLFPTFNEKMRADIYEESIRFFQDLFQGDEPIDSLLDADYAFLNDRLAKHYAIPGVEGPQFRKVQGVQKFGRGGILTLASVQSKEAAASRTSPVLRGNWVVETLLGEKLPRPPPDVPKLPEEEGAEGLSTRQMVEKHTQNRACAVCHDRIDPIGFAFERYDAIGRFRLKEASGLPIDCTARTKDGVELNGIDGLRHWLLTKKRDVVVRLFCRRLLGYALGRSVILSDQSTLDEMMSALRQNNGKLSAAVLTIVRSPQFRSIRGSDYNDEVE